LKRGHFSLRNKSQKYLFVISHVGRQNIRDATKDAVKTCGNGQACEAG